MTNAALNLLAKEVVRTTKPSWEKEKQSYFYSLSKILVSEIEYNYDHNAFGDKEYIKKLMQIKLDKLLDEK
ncbi:hypothetical protein FZC74_14945 [Sutcliffiella horikoshii]|uniref:Uncharacterized protein n=1 Tax=Sutcliffiella horikoshii TaxID=79883 RepID=A0AA94WP30_9BACI|nr:hypothetical protein [Sutcliffiella horikoshii]TYS57724.1 hypothetical protein FZC74_14945 [Sutcliffiella horikoshii]